MEQTNAIPIVLRNNPKDVVLAGLKRAFKDFGPLRVPVDFTKEYPSRETWTTVNDGNSNVPKRRIVVKKISNSPALQSIGDTYTGQFEFMQGIPTDLAAIKETGLGWIDNYTIEVSVWSTDADDRDNLVELIKLIMLELTQGRTVDNPIPFFTTNGVLSVKFVRESDAQASGKIGNGVVYSGSTTWNLLVPFYNVSREEFIRYKFELLDNIINNPGNGTNPGGTTPSDPIIIDVGSGKDDETKPPGAVITKPPNEQYAYDGVLVLPVGGGGNLDPTVDNQTIVVDPHLAPDEHKGGTLTEFFKE